MFIIPYGDENPTRRVPYVNLTLIVINVIVYLGLGFTSLYPDLVQMLGFVPSKAIYYTYFTSIFLHGSILHLIGNMLYLYIVGDNVEDKLGHVGYLAFYLICGAVADFFHGKMVAGQMLDLPCIGASGAISAVLGAYVLLFPKNKITFFYLFWIIIFIRWGTFKLASFWAIGLWFGLQLLSNAQEGAYSGVAYGAHIGGFIGGFLIVGLLALVGILKPHWHKERDLIDVVREEEGLPDDDAALSPTGQRPPAPFGSYPGEVRDAPPPPDDGKYYAEVSEDSPPAYDGRYYGEKLMGEPRMGENLPPSPPSPERKSPRRSDYW